MSKDGEDLGEHAGLPLRLDAIHGTKEMRTDPKRKTYHKLLQRFLEKLVVDAHSARMLDRRKGIFDH